jgi:hypothetical protein
MRKSGVRSQESEVFDALPMTTGYRLMLDLLVTEHFTYFLN